MLSSPPLIVYDFERLDIVRLSRVAMETYFKNRVGILHVHLVLYLRSILFISGEEMTIFKGIDPPKI